MEQQLYYTRRFSNRDKEKGLSIIYINRKKNKRRNNSKNTREKGKICSKGIRLNRKKYKKEFYRKFKTITFDNGGEFRDWKGLEKSYDGRRKGVRTQVYYAHPYRSGERGSNENANRLIRRFIPKGIDITPISEEYIQKTEDWTNNYPRAMFNFKSTNEILSEMCA